MFVLFSFFFVNDTATTEIYTLSLHDALPISQFSQPEMNRSASNSMDSSTKTIFVSSSDRSSVSIRGAVRRSRSEEHTSELQSHVNLVCRLLLEKKKKIKKH